jgi:TatD DNase family protein
MNLIDTHCHLVHGRLCQQVSEVLQRASDACVRAVIAATGDLQDSKASLHIAERFPGVWCMAGIHPHESAAAPQGYLKVLEDLAARARNVALGEIGLDYHYDYSPRDAQKRVFAEQLELTRRLGKPVVVHTREAFEDTMAILRDSGVDAGKCVMHSFTGDADQARRVLEWGAWISFSGIVTFRSADDVRDAARITPDDRLLIETDAPFLSPEPVRKMRPNEPANVAHTARFLADLRGADPEALGERTTTNAIAFFGIDLP